MRCPFCAGWRKEKSATITPLGKIPGEENGLQRGEANLRCALAQFGPDWDCQRIRKTNRSLFAREDLEKQAREMAAAASRAPGLRGCSFQN